MKLERKFDGLLSLRHFDKRVSLKLYEEKCGM